MSVATLAGAIRVAGQAHDGTDRDFAFARFDGEPDLPESMPALPGTKLGHFHDGKPVAEGHSGVVFRAQDIKEKRDVTLVHGLGGSGGFFLALGGLRYVAMPRTTASSTSVPHASPATGTRSS